jgi:hypothetical protein
MADNDTHKSFLEKIMEAHNLAQAKSIAAQARENIFMYRVAISQSVGDVKLAIAINKYIETMCCIFTMIVSGINPLVKNNDELKDIIKKISAEGFTPEHQPFEYSDIFKRVKMLSTEYVIPFNEQTQFPRIGKHFRSEEGVIEDDKNEEEDNEKNDVKSWSVDPHFSEKLEKRPGYPTIMKITFHVNGGDIVVPVAVKANPQAMGSEEMKMFIESVLSGRSYKFIRYFKWKSGEISTLEYILGTDIAKRDQTLYKSLGRNPIYIEFMKRKANSKFMGTLKALIANKENAIGPTGSLIVTTDDLVNATKLDVRSFTKNDEFIHRIMQQTFIMCFGIVDINMEVVSFYFMGYKEPFRLNFAELGVGTNVDTNKQLEQAILELSRKVA